MLSWGKRRNQLLVTLEFRPWFYWNVEMYYGYVGWHGVKNEEAEWGRKEKRVVHHSLSVALCPSIIFRGDVRLWQMWGRRTKFSHNVSKGFPSKLSLLVFITFTNNAWKIKICQQLEVCQHNFVRGRGQWGFALFNPNPQATPLVNFTHKHKRDDSQKVSSNIIRF